MNRKTNTLLTQQRQEQIKTAARICFGCKGFHGSSMADVIQGSGLAAAQIYRHFPSKASLIVAVTADLAAQWREFLTVRLGEKICLHQVFDRHSSFWSGWTQNQQQLLLEIYAEASRNEEISAILLREEQQLLALFSATETTPHSRAEIEIFLLIIDGMICRSFNPFQADKQELSRIERELYR